MWLRGILFTLYLSLFVNYSIQELLKVSIYYESLCPDSIRFITRQLKGAYSTVGEKIIVDFVPYGKAVHNLVDGKWKFQCQHGPRECYGNKMQACALNQNSSQGTNVNFVTCVMGQQDPSSDAALQTCAENAKISWDSMVKCRDDGTADNLLAIMGEKTYAVNPQITFVPTIIYNDSYDDENQQNSLSDFIGVVCQLLENEKPDGCPAQKKMR